MSFRRKFAHATKVISWHGQSCVANQDARQELKYDQVISASLDWWLKCSYGAYIMIIRLSIFYTRCYCSTKFILVHVNMFDVCGDFALCLYHYANVTCNGSLHELPRLLHIPRPEAAGLLMGYETWHPNGWSKYRWR